MRMTEESRKFLEQNLPDALRAEKLVDVLDMLFDWIEEAMPLRTTTSITTLGGRHSGYMMIFT